jgi:hypothetical protein
MQGARKQALLRTNVFNLFYFLAKVTIFSNLKKKEIEENAQAFMGDFFSQSQILFRSVTSPLTIYGLVLLQNTKLQEMSWPMILMLKLTRTAK